MNCSIYLYLQHLLLNCHTFYQNLNPKLIHSSILQTQSILKHFLNFLTLTNQINFQSLLIQFESHYLINIKV